MLHRAHNGGGCVLASTLCTYDLRKGDLFVLRWARVRRVIRGSISSELLMCSGGARSICYCFLWLDALRQYMYVYGTCLFYVCCGDCVGVCGNVCCVAAVVENSEGLALEC